MSITQEILKELHDSNMARLKQLAGEGMGLDPTLIMDMLLNSIIDVLDAALVGGDDEPDYSFRREVEFLFNRKLGDTIDKAETQLRQAKLLHGTGAAMPAGVTVNEHPSGLQVPNGG